MTYLYIDPTGRGTTSTNNEARYLCFQCGEWVPGSHDLHDQHEQPQYVYGNDPEHDSYEWPYYPPFRNPQAEEKR